MRPLRSQWSCSQENQTAAEKKKTKRDKSRKLALYRGARKLKYLKFLITVILYTEYITYYYNVLSSD